jgi:hypothetical protein
LQYQWSFWLSVEQNLKRQTGYITALWWLVRNIITSIISDAPDGLTTARTADYQFSWQDHLSV